MVNTTQIHTLLEEIAKIILINSSFTSNTGLYYGKTGAAMFLYHYYDYAGNDLYADNADEIVVEITSLLNESRLHYTNGLSGVAWGINYLSENDFIDIKAETFSGIDTAIIKACPAIDLTIEACGITSYFYTRIKDEVSDNETELHNMLLLERIIGQIDNIDASEGKNKLVNTEEYSSLMKDDEKQNSLAHFTTTYTMSAILLKKAASGKIYPQITAKLIREVQAALGNMIKKTCNYYMLLPASNYTYNSKLINKLCSLFNAYVQLGTLTDKADDLSVLVHDTLARSIPDDEFNAALEINTLININSANNIIHNAALNELSASRTKHLITHLSEGSNLVSSFLLDKEALNIGLTGLSGLGLLLLTYVSPDCKQWEKALMIN